MSEQEASNTETPPEPEPQPAANAAPPPIDPTKTHQVAEFKHDKSLTTCRLDPTGQFVFAGAEDNNIYRWELESGEKVVLSGHESWVRSMDFSPDGQRLYTAGWDGQVRWWVANALNPESFRVLQAHRGFARWVQTSPCGKMLATCGNDRFVRVWDVDSGEQIIEMAGHNRHPYAVVFHPSDGMLVSEDLMGEVFVWDPHKSRRIATIDASIMTGYDNKFAADMGGARDMAFSADGATLACAGITNVVNSFAGQQDPIIVLVDWATKKITHHLQGKDKATGVMWGVRFHPDGFIVGAVGKQNGRGELLFWRTDDAESAEKPADAAGEVAKASTDGKPSELKSFHALQLDKCARGIDFTPDAQRIAVAHNDGLVRIYEMAEKPAEAKPDEEKPADEKTG
jgi:WD40 repeat protein